MINSFEDFIKDLRINCVIADLDTNSFFERAEAKQLDVNTFHREGDDFTKRDNDSHLVKFIIYNCGDLIRVNEFLNANNWLLFDPEIIEDAKTWPTSLTLTAPELYQILRRKSRVFRERALKSIGNYQAMTELLNALNQHNGESRFAELCSKYDTNLDTISKVVSIVSLNSDSNEDPACQLMFEERTDFLLWLQQRNFDALCSEYRKSTAEKILRKKSVELSWLFDQEATIGDWEPHAYLKLCESCINSIKAEFRDDSYNRSLKLWIFSYKQLLLTLSQWPNSIQEIVLNSNLIPFFMSPIVDDVLTELENLMPQLKRCYTQIGNLISKSQNKAGCVDYGTYRNFASEEKSTSRLNYFKHLSPVILKNVKNLAKKLSEIDLEFGPYLNESDVVRFCYLIGGGFLDKDTVEDNEHILWLRNWPSLKYIFIKILERANESTQNLTKNIAENFEFYKNGMRRSYAESYIKDNPENFENKDIRATRFTEEERDYLRELLKQHDLFPRS